MIDAIRAMEHAFTGESETPLRSLVGGSLVMPGRLDDLMAVKVVSIVPGNPSGLVLLFGGDGSPVGIVDGPTLTAIRTGAVSGLAIRILAKEKPSKMGMLGAGAMAFDQIEAGRAVRELSDIRVWSRSLENAAALADRVGGTPVEDPEQAIADADIISCATPAREPLFPDEAVKPGAHVNAVGAFTPEMVELPEALLGRAFVVVDDVDAAAAEAGDLIQASRDPDATLAEILGDFRRPTDAEVTIFKSVGIAAQDVAAANVALSNAVDLGLGTDLS